VISFTKAVLGATVVAALAFSATACSSTSANADPGNNGGAASPEVALSSYLTDVVKDDFPGACMMMGLPPDDGLPAQPRGQALCATAASDPQARAVVMDIAKTITPANTNAATTKVVVTGVTGTGASVEVADTQVTIDGRSLHDIAATNSKGAKSTVSFQVDQIGGLWYVIDYDVHD
jgi:hypothetical protein